MIQEPALPKKDGTVQVHEQNLGPEGSNGAETEVFTCLFYKAHVLSEKLYVWKTLSPAHTTVSVWILGSLVIPVLSEEAF